MRPLFDLDLDLNFDRHRLLPTMAVSEGAGGKSRREKRKEARQEKGQKRFHSWIQYQKDQNDRKKKYMSLDLKVPAVEKELERKPESLGKLISMEKRNKGLKEKPKNKFEEFLEMDMNRGHDDGISELFEGIPLVSDSMFDDSAADVQLDAKEEGVESSPSGKKKRKRKSSSSSTKQPELETAVSEQINVLNEEEPCAEVPPSTVKKGSKRKSKTKFQEFLEMEMRKGGVTVEEDLEMERRLAKKLKVKGRKLANADDGINELLEEFPSVLDSMFNDSTIDDEQEAEEKSVEHVLSSKKKRKRIKSSRTLAKLLDDEVVARVQESETSEQIDGSNEEEPCVKAPGMDVSKKYVAPHLRARATDESEEILQIRRRVRGLLNRLSESNVESVAEEVSTIFRSIGRSVGCQVIGEEVIASCSGGPRGNEQYAAVFASFVAGMACLVGVDFSAKLISSVAKSFENEFLKEDGLSLRNLTLLLSYLCIFGVCSSDLIYDLLSMLSKRLTEMDVSTILTILQCCGMKLRGDDPTAMKDFVLSIQSRVNELKSISANDTQDAKPKINSKRMEFMLETICDIKNNKKRSKEDPAHHTRIKKWLQKLRVEGVLLRGLTWSKLLDTQKKGQWWLSGEIASTTDNIKEVVPIFDIETIEAQKMVQLAAAQRMNTDIRRAIFCIIMSGEDYLDAFEKILRLDLYGKQDREVMRVLVECCLQEKVFNKYYTVLASKLCTYDKNHKFTLQYCIWDHFKELESMELNRSMNLARFVAEMLSSFMLSLALLKTVDLADPSQLTPKRIMHFRMLFDAVFENKDADVWNIFTRIAGNPELEMLCSSLTFFIKQYVVDANPEEVTKRKFEIAKKALNNVARGLM